MSKYDQEFMSEKVLNWVKYAELLLHIYEKEPKAEFSGLTCSLQNNGSCIQPEFNHPGNTPPPPPKKFP